MFAGTQYYHLGIFLVHRVAIVTDGDSGIGLQTAHELAKRGAHVYMTGKDRQSVERAREEVMQRSRNGKVFARVLDLGSLDSVRKFVKEFQSEQSHLNILINNGEVFLADGPAQSSADGHELHLAYNHLAPFLLTNLLLGTLHAAPESTRIVNVTSSLHGWADMQRADLQFRNGDGRRPYSRLAAYAQSKLANMLFTRQLALRLRRRVDGANKMTTVTAVHPGFVRSAAMRRCMGAVGYWLVWFFLKTEHSGAQTTLCAALEPRFKHETGGYLSDCAVVEDGRRSEASRDDELAKWLWEESERLTGLREG